MTAHANQTGTIKLIDTSHAKVAGSWVAIQAGYAKVSGVWQPFYSAETVVIAPTLLTSQNVANIFNNAEAGLWASTKKKRLIVNSAIGPLVVNSAPGGSVTIEVQSGATVSGIGGAAGTVNVGGAGGDAISVTVATGINLLNNGTIRGGGGGGGKGGQGGAGTGTIREPASGDYYSNPNYAWAVTGSLRQVNWNGSVLVNDSGGGSASAVVGAYTYYRGTYRTNDFGTDMYGVYRTSSTPTTGGAGGNGGRGQGADGANANGVAGSAGGSNAGNGGAGGNGGTYGNGGASGSTGSAGNAGSGVAGSSGGAAGRAVLGYNRVNYSGSGTLTGGTANN